MKTYFEKADGEITLLGSSRLEGKVGDG